MPSAPFKGEIRCLVQVKGHVLCLQEKCIKKRKQLILCPSLRSGGKRTRAPIGQLA